MNFRTAQQQLNTVYEKGGPVVSISWTPGSPGSQSLTLENTKRSKQVTILGDKVLKLYAFLAAHAEDLDILTVRQVPTKALQAIVAQAER